MSKEANNKILIRMQKLIKLVHINLNHFPKHEKYGLSLQIRSSMFNMYGLIVECQRRYHKRTSLTNLNVEHA